MEVCIIGNGILGLTAAYRIVKRDKDAKIHLVGPSNQHGCASLAAAAMFNSFAEIDGYTLKNEIETKKFLFNKESTPLWPSLLKEIEEDAGQKLEYGFGTFVINNHASDSLEDENFEAIVQALQKYDGPYQEVEPSSIPKYKPSSSGRAARAIYIEKEGWVNPVLLISALQKILEKSGRVSFVNAYCSALHRKGDKIEYAALENGENVRADIFFLAPGATFSKIVDNSNLGIRFPRIFYGVGSSILLKTKENTIPNCIRTPNRGLACGIYTAPHNGSHTLVGATNLISPAPIENATANNIYALLKSAIEQINSDYFRSEVVKINIGWRPTSEDTLALIGQTSIQNLYVATGTKRDGLHCSPIISAFIADMILSGKSAYDMGLFWPERIPIKFYTRAEAIEIAVRHTINAAYQHDFVPAKNRMLDDLESYYRTDLEKLHDRIGAIDWGIPPEMLNMYRYGHIGAETNV